MTVEPLYGLRLCTPRVELRLGTSVELAFHGLGTESPRGTPVVKHGLRLERANLGSPVPVEIQGLAPCLVLFGA